MNQFDGNTTARGAVSDLGFDPDALRDRYRLERDKRVRSDGHDQYIEVAGDFSHYVDDPYSEIAPRSAVTDGVEVLIVGGGFAGLYAAARLREAGVDDIRIVERGGDFGGVWYWNRYPGAQCDIESYIYLPLLEETDYIPTEKYAHQPEIFAHAQRIGKHYDLYGNALFQTRITDLQWSDEQEKWQVTTDRGDNFAARLVITCTGAQEKPKLPGIPGIDGFTGHTFHTSRWDYSYTGGDVTGDLHKLADKRMAIIGTGATGIQCTPYVAKDVGHLYVFQRTPSMVNERGNRPTDPAWVDNLTPGWQKRRMDNCTTVVFGGPPVEDLINDAWTRAGREITSVYSSPGWGALSEAEQNLKSEIADFTVMNKIRARVDTIVNDVRTAEALKPWYRFTSKRPTFNDGFLPAFNRDNVTLVDTNGRGVDRITESGLVVDGQEYEVDCIVFATGFELATGYTRRVGFEIHGRNGVTLTEYWENGTRTLHGHSSHGFPNLFHIGTGQVGFSINYIEIMEEQVDNLVEIIKGVKRRRASTVEVTAEAEADWVATIIAGAESRLEFLLECTPGYFNNEGRPVRHGKGVADSAFAGGFTMFREILASWRSDGEMAGLKFTR